jgi:beta-glucosidase
MAAAAEAARRADAVVVVVGTDDAVESEGYDRPSMDLPGDQDELVRRVLVANRRSVVVVTSGSPVAMDWAEDAGAVVQSFFGGQELAHALVDVLAGDADPGGRLPVTLPLRLEDTPAFADFPGESSHVRYGEGLLVGYRWYEARRIPVRFPFGHGLSYTSFEIGEPRLEVVPAGREGGPAGAPADRAASGSDGARERSGAVERLGRGERVLVEVTVRNIGERPGSEVVQCYVAPPARRPGPDGGQGGGSAGGLRPGRRFRPPKELRAFLKVRLSPGESATVGFELGERAFAHYDVADLDWEELVRRRPPAGEHGEQGVHRTRSGWYVEPGRYELLVGRSSDDIAQHAELEVEGGDDPLDAALLPG